MTCQTDHSSVQPVLTVTLLHSPPPRTGTPPTLSEPPPTTLTPLSALTSLCSLTSLPALSALHARLSAVRPSTVPAVRWRLRGDDDERRLVVMALLR